MEVYIIEIWKDILGYEGFYQVSNQGRIRSLDRVIIKRNGVAQPKRGRIITLIKNSDGYLSFKLCKNDKSKTVRVHQIVARHFLEFPRDFDTNTYEVNHKDYNRENNCVDNLEWCTHQDNVKHSCVNGRYKIRDFNGVNNPNYGNHVLSTFYKNNPDVAKEKLSRPANQNGRAVKIELYDKDMNYIDTFDWIGGCANYLRDNGYTTASIDNIREKIRVAAKENKKYIGHYFKRIA